MCLTFQWNSTLKVKSKANPTITCMKNSAGFNIIHLNDLYLHIIYNNISYAATVGTSAAWVTHTFCIIVNFAIFWQLSTYITEWIFMCGCVWQRQKKKERERENISELKKDMYNIHNTDELFLNRSLLLEENWSVCKM